MTNGRFPSRHKSFPPRTPSSTLPDGTEKTFVWEYYDKDKNYRRIPENTADGISPLDFYKQIVKPIFNMEDKICLVNDPRATSPYYRLI